MLGSPPGRVQEAAARPVPSGHDGQQAPGRAPAEASNREGHPAGARTPEEPPAAAHAQPRTRGGEAAVARPGQHGPDGTGPPRSGEGVPAGRETPQHAGRDHGGEKAQPHPDAQGGPAGTPGADRAAGGDRHPVPRPEAGNPAGGDAAREGKLTPSLDSHIGRSAHAGTAESQPDARGRRDHHQAVPARPEGTVATPRAGQGQSDAWPPPQVDRDRVRDLYAEDFGSKQTGAGRDRGSNVVGDEPVKSPGDTSDLPPTGDELVETADKEAPRPEQFRNRLYKRLDDIDDAVTNAVPTVQDVLAQPPPTGSPGAIADTHAHWAPESTPNATPSIGSIAEVVLVAGILADRAIHWASHKVANDTGRGQG
jgi:hypothetical protein